MIQSCQLFGFMEECPSQGLKLILMWFSADLSSTLAHQMEDVYCPKSVEPRAALRAMRVRIRLHEMTEGRQKPHHLFNSLDLSSASATTTGVFDGDTDT
jgi:hypothetical protein